MGLSTPINMKIVRGYFARIRAIEDDGCRLYVEYQNGQVVTFDRLEPFEFEVGSIVLISEEGNEIDIEQASDEHWLKNSWVGIVCLVSEEFVIVDCNGILRKFPVREDMPCYKGNTVEVRDEYGVVRILSEEPIKHADLLEDNEGIVAKFKIEPGAIQETFDDFGGLAHVIARARELIEVPLKYKKALSTIGARPIKGVLFTGLPGTGKTMLAKIIANSTEAVFYEISGPEVLSKWYGQSEGILRALFADAAKQEQAIIFFDEIDSLAGQRAEESHEASRRVVAQLLTLMDGFTKNDNVIVIATTNRPQDIDAALRRPGRFDWEVNFPLPTGSDRELILQVSARKLETKGSLPHAWIAQKTDSWSAAELAAIWSEAALLAATDEREAIIAEDYVGGYERVSNQKDQARQISLGGVAI